MTILYDGDIWVSYRYIFLTSGAVEQPDVISCRGGQVNGLCGAAVSGVLGLLTGAHTGCVPLKVELLEMAPAFDPAWDEVVEVSYDPLGADLALYTFGDNATMSLRSAGPHRARYSASGMDAAAESEGRDPGEPAIDRYLLQLWPTSPDADRSDVILRQTSKQAAYWHQVARDTPAPPPPPKPEQVEAARLAETERRERQMREMLEAHILQSWGGRPPTPRLQALTAIEANGLASRDRDLVDLIAATREPEQRRIAWWAAARAHALVEEPYAARLAPALDAVRLGRPLRAPFDSQEGAFDRLFDTAPGTTTTVAVAVTINEPPTRPTPEVVALFTILAAARTDPLDAALASVRYALLGEDDDAAYLTEVRREVERFA